ncbi:MAG TPA: LysR family transcriptional regulator [Gammaproteobacteria bacterium]|nr:LysR family transcriptional regulator [Gammaproteobacteria bacterium]
MDPITDIAVFVRVAELGSFTRAADALEISKAAVSKSIGRLEKRLGARLLHRTTRKLTLTEAGDTFFRRGVAALAELNDAQQEISQLSQTPRGLLRVTAPTYLGSVTLAPLLHEFQKRYPEVSLDLNLNDQRVDLVQERFDVGVRISTMTDSGLVSRRLASCPIRIVASPDYLKRHGTPKLPADLRQHDCLTYSVSRTPNEWRLRAPNGRWVTAEVKGRIRCNNDFVIKQAAIDGLGIAFFPSFFVDREIADGRLVQVLKGYDGPSFFIQAVYPTRRHLPSKVRVFVDFLVEHLGKI